MIKKVVRLFRPIRPKVNLYPNDKKGKSWFNVFALYSDDIYVSWYDGKSDKAGTHVYCYSTVYTHTPLTTYPSPPPSNFTRKCESFREIGSLGGALGHAKYILSEVKNNKQQMILTQQIEWGMCWRIALFQELLEKAEENSSGEEQWDINFRKHTQHTDSSSKKKKKKVSESSKKGGSLSNLSCLSDFEVGFSTFIACNFKTMILLHLNKNIKKWLW